MLFYKLLTYMTRIFEIYIHWNLLHKFVNAFLMFNVYNILAGFNVIRM